MLHLQFWLQARRLIIVTIRTPVMHCQLAVDGWVSLMECSVFPYVSLKYLSLSECSSFSVLNPGRPGSSSYKLVVCDLGDALSVSSSSSCFSFPPDGEGCRVMAYLQMPVYYYVVDTYTKYIIIIRYISFYFYGKQAFLNFCLHQNHLEVFSPNRWFWFGSPAAGT